MTKQWGGRRPASGRLRRRIQLDPETATLLAQFTKQQRIAQSQPDLTEDEVVKQLIHEAHQRNVPSSQAEENRK